jgi:hypothetical protein
MTAGRDLKAASTVLLMMIMGATGQPVQAAPPVATPQQLADRLVDFADEGCDYLNGLKRRPNKPLDDGSRRQAAHFGRVLGQERRGDGTEYRLSVSAFPGWQARYWLQSLTLAPPPTQAIALAHFEKRLGKGEVPDAQYRAKLGTPPEGATDFLFRAGPGHLGCDVLVTVGSDKRVSAFRLAR